MARKRKKHESPSMNLPLTAMIDVVFQLLIYLIVTAKPLPVIANLDVFQPSAQAGSPPNKQPPKMIRILVFADGYVINEKAVSVTDLDRLLVKLASLDKNQTIMVTCNPLSQHEKLIQVLDMCKKNGLTNLSVMSSN